MSLIIPTSTSTFPEIATVSQDMFSSILPYLYTIIGIVLAFYIIETIRFWMSDYPERYNRLEDIDRKRGM
jgi:hypothetical protein